MHFNTTVLSHNLHPYNIPHSIFSAQFQAHTQIHNKLLNQKKKEMKFVPFSDRFSTSFFPFPDEFFHTLSLSFHILLIPYIFPDLPSSKFIQSHLARLIYRFICKCGKKNQNSGETDMRRWKGKKYPQFNFQLNLLCCLLLFNRRKLKKWF